MNQNKQPGALPCPFCGGHSTLDSNGQDFRVFCWDCGAKSKEFDCWQKAEASWNRRTHASQVQRVPLSNQDAETIVRDCDYDPLSIVRMTEAKHGITQERQG